MMVSGPLHQCANKARDWLLEACFPLWAGQGVRQGGFCEALDWDYQAIASDRARVRVQARQTHMFAVAKQLGWQPKRADELIGLGLETLQTTCRTDQGLFGREVDLQAGQLVSDLTDLYDTAFGVLAFASARRVGFETDQLLAEMLTALDTHMTSPSGGFLEALPTGPFRLQNPHMHLFEACLEAYAATSGRPYLDYASNLYRLCIARFIDAETGTLGEAFNRSDWSVPDGERGSIVEPGHHFEWVWLFEQYTKAAGTELTANARRFYDFACRTVDETGRAVQSVTRQGQWHDSSARTWPQTEALKAHLAMMRAGDAEAEHRAIQSFNLLMETYLTDRGGWKDHFAADGTLLATTIPASTGYHVVVAFLDLIETARA